LSHSLVGAVLTKLRYNAADTPETRKPRAKPPRRYSWSLRLRIDDPRLRSLDLDGLEGLEYARHLARAARYRRLAALENGIAPPAFGVKDLAAHEDVSPTHILNRIKQARIQLFGKDISDSAIYYQLRHPQPPERPCAEESCLFALPRHAPSHRRYCFLHTDVRARVRRHRRRAKAHS
jgi:hypothetical protein